MMNINSQNQEYVSTELPSNGGFQTAAHNTDGAVEIEIGAIKNTNGTKSAGDFKDELSKLLKEASFSDSDSVKNDKKSILDDLDFGEIYKLDAVKIDKNDAMFFVNVLNQNGLMTYQNDGDNYQLTTKNAQAMEVSKTLCAVLEKANQSKKPVRLDFENNMTVILRLDNQGKINAQFIPGDKAVEEYLRNNIPYLKQRFEEQNIPYAQLNYRQHQDNNQKNNKENKDE